MRISDWSSDVCSSDLQGNLRGALDPDDAVVVFPGQEAQRKADHPAGMAEHTVDGPIGLAGVRGAEDGRHPAFREERHVPLENRSCPNPLQGIPVTEGPNSPSRGGVTSGTKGPGGMHASVRPPAERSQA